MILEDQGTFPFAALRAHFKDITWSIKLTELLGGAATWQQTQDLPTHTVSKVIENKTRCLALSLAQRYLGYCAPSFQTRKSEKNSLRVEKKRPKGEKSLNRPQNSNKWWEPTVITTSQLSAQKRRDRKTTTRWLAFLYFFVGSWKSSSNKASRALK